MDDPLNREVGILADLGVQLELNTPVSAAGILRKIIDTHRAVVVAAGPRIRPLLEKASINLPERGAVTGRPSNCQCSAAGIFAAGSLLSPGCSFVGALVQGKTAALCADRYLRGEAVPDPPRRFHSRIGRLLEGEITEFLEEAADIPRVTPAAGPTPPTPRPGTTGGYSREEATAEASRCLQCDCAAKDSCLLRNYAEKYDARARRFRIGERRPVRRIRQHPEVIYEPGKCIKCGICVRITALENEQLGLAFLNRGYDLQIGAPFGELLSRALQHSAERCVRSCPTGALYFRRPSRKEP
jgi:ferredoxin